MVFLACGSFLLNLTHRYLKRLNALFSCYADMKVTTEAARLKKLPIMPSNA